MNLLPDDFDINELDVAEIATWPRVIQYGVIVLFSIVLLFLVYWFDIKEKSATLERFTISQEEFKQDFENKYGRAKNYPVYLEQKKLVEARLAQVLELLPKKAEVPGLVDSVSEQGSFAGLNFRSIRMRPELKSDFVVELPMEINVVGSYHELATFVSLIAKMPRILTLHDFSIGIMPENELKNYTQGGSAQLLRMILTAKTYRYVELEAEK